MKINKNIRFTIRLSEEEKIQIEEIAAECDMNLSEFIRTAIKRLVRDYINGQFPEDDYI